MMRLRLDSGLGKLVLKLVYPELRAWLDRALRLPERERQELAEKLRVKPGTIDAVETALRNLLLETLDSFQKSL